MSLKDIASDLEISYPTVKRAVKFLSNHYVTFIPATNQYKVSEIIISKYDKNAGITKELSKDGAGIKNDTSGEPPLIPAKNVTPNKNKELRLSKNDKNDKNEILYNNTPHFHYVSKKTQELLKRVDKRGFNIYQLLGKMRKEIECWIPDEVVNRVCESWLKNSNKVTNVWPWFIMATKENWKTWNAEQSVKEGQDYKKAIIPKKMMDIIKSMDSG